MVLVTKIFQTFGFNSGGRGYSTSDLNAMGRDLRSAVNDLQNAVTGSYQQAYYAPNTNGVLINRLLPTVVAQEELGRSLNSAVTSVFTDSFDNTDELQSFFARLNYTLNDKYLFTATMRADGSSRFGPENQYGYFPSGAFAWKMNEEDFVGENVSTLKLRLSAGITGNQDGLGYGNFVARQRFSGLTVQQNLEINANGTAIVATDRPDLKWESSFNLNAGLDFGFNNDRLSGSIDIYRTETTDVLLQTPPAAPAVDPFQFQNVDASIINQGIEFALAYDFVRTDDATFPQILILPITTMRFKILMDLLTRVRLMVQVFLAPLLNVLHQDNLYIHTSYQFSQVLIVPELQHTKM